MLNDLNAFPYQQSGGVTAVAVLIPIVPVMVAPIALNGNSPIDDGLIWGNSVLFNWWVCFRVDIG